MFEKRPFWGIIVGLNVCVLIWLISVQQPVMYDASTAIISSSLQQNNAGAGGAGAGAAVGFVALGALTPPRGGRDDRDVRGQQQQPPQLAGKHLLSNSYYNVISSSSSTLATNFSSSNNTNVIQDSVQVAAAVKTTTDAIDQSAGMHSLTSSLGTGVLDAKVRPTPSWMKLTAVSSALPDEDFNQLIDLQQFHYIVPQPVCSSDIEALILVHSAPKNHEKRQIIRETWASIGRHTIDAPLRVLFLLGAVENEQLQQELVQENNQFADMIQGSFVDDYRNMTYKHVMAFKWFLYNCPEAQILIKVDDDVYVNTPQLLKYLKKKEKEQRPSTPKQTENKGLERDKNPTIITMNNDTPTTTTTTATESTNSNSIFDSFRIFTSRLSSAPSSSSSSSSSAHHHQFNASEEIFHQPQNLLFCQKIIGSLVKRSYRSKWRVGFKEYGARYYPPYCPGYAIIYSPDVVFRLYTAAQQSKYFWIDDVHITGVLAQQTNTTITTSSHYVLYSDECDRLLTGKTDLNDVEFLFAWHSISAHQIRALWHLQMMMTQRRSGTENDVLLHPHREDNASATLDLAKRRISSNISTTYQTAESFR